MKRALTIISLVLVCISSFSCTKEQIFKKSFEGTWGLTLRETISTVNGVPYGETLRYTYNPDDPGSLPDDYPPFLKMEVNKESNNTFKVSFFTWNNEEKFWGIDGPYQVWTVRGDKICTEVFTNNFDVVYSLDGSALKLETFTEYEDDLTDGKQTVKVHTTNVYQRMSK